MLKKLLTVAAFAAATWAGTTFTASTAAEAHGWHHRDHCRDNMCYYNSPWHHWHHWRSGYEIDHTPWWIWQNLYPYHHNHKHHWKKRHHHRHWYGTHCWMQTDWHHHIPYDVKVCKTVYP